MIETQLELLTKIQYIDRYFYSSTIIFVKNNNHMKRFKPEQQHSEDDDGNDSGSNSKDQGREEQHITAQGQPEVTTSIFENLLRQYLQTTMANPSNNSNNNYQPPSDRHTSCASSGHAHHSNGANHTCSESMIESLFKIVTDQTKSLEALSHKVEEAALKNAHLTRKVRELELQNQRLHMNVGQRDPHPHIGSSEPKIETKFQGEEISKEQLLQILFGQKKYEFELELKEPLEQPLYRERNFNIRLGLVDSTGNYILNDNKIPMSLALYTCENPPKFIEKNTTGQKMLKGYIDQSLLNGECMFEKIQIREVTSHYRNSWLYLVVIPCMTPLGAIKTKNSIDFTKIKPLVLAEVVVKAKKPKKQARKQENKEQGQESDEA